MTKVDIFSGFLGAGKTTLIKKLIKEVYTGEKLVLIENEFGEIGIDGGFLQEAGINITEMNSGCICCSLVGDFGQALQKVIAEFAPDRILIEPSGVGKLSDVIKAVEDQHIEGLCLNSCVTVADAGKCKMYMKNFGEFFNNQIEHAGCIVLSRTDGIKEDKLHQAIELIREHNEKAEIIAAPWDTITGEQILEAMEHRNTLEDELKKMEEEHHHHHHHGEECCCGHEHHEHHHHDDECHCHEHDHHHSHEHHHGDICHTHEHDHHHAHEHDHDHGHECHCHEHEDHEHECHDHEHHEHECHCEGHAHHPGDEKCREHHGEDHDMEHCCHHEHHEHHHHHDEECCCGHDHHEHYHHHHDEECCCGHDHHEHHHHHGETCSCGHDHHADEVFTSWGKETAKKFTAEEISAILDALDSGKYGTVLRAKGIVNAEGEWIHFDFVPGEKDVRRGGAAVMGRLCVIGADIDEKCLEELFAI